MKLDEKMAQKGNLITEKDRIRIESSKLEAQIENTEETVAEEKDRLASDITWLEQQTDIDGLAYQEAEKKYQLNRRSKSARTIAENFAPKRTQFLNEKEELLNGASGLKALQYHFNSDFTVDFMIGTEGMADYREARQKLKSVEMVRYEEKLKQAKDNCEEIFKSDFLSKMKEHIESVHNEFRSLNKALDNIYYGDDSYHFKISFDKKKEGLYRMITSESNQEGINLWTNIRTIVPIWITILKSAKEMVLCSVSLISTEKRAEVKLRFPITLRLRHPFINYIGLETV